MDKPRQSAMRTEAGQKVHTLATDLDGTLIPLEGSQENIDDLQKLAQLLEQQQIGLVFVTGRHQQSIEDALTAHRLPLPDWIICDVGTTILSRELAGGFRIVGEYHEHQIELTRSMPLSEVRREFRRFDELRLQEEPKQGLFKLSYYLDASRIDELVPQVEQFLGQLQAPYSIIHSLDPFNQVGLLDVLPLGVSKAYALQWWMGHCGKKEEDIVFAGDSGNDFSALTANYRAILVANATKSLIDKVREVRQRSAVTTDLYVAERSATSGVLEGLKWFVAPDPLQHGLVLPSAEAHP